MGNRAYAFVAALLLAACSNDQGPAALPGEPSAASRAILPSWPITHIVVVVQENRTVDNLFQFLPGANTASYGLDQKGNKIKLEPRSLSARYDIEHRHPDWLAAYNDGAMNGWDDERCEGKCPRRNAPYGYVPQNQVQPYYDMAEAYAFGDELFETGEGPSFPAHQYIVSGTSTNHDGSKWRVSEDVGGDEGGCDSSPGSTVMMINLVGREGNPVFPCFNRMSIFTLLDAAGISWHFYQERKGRGPWNSVDALKPIWQNQVEYSANVSTPSSQVLTDIEDGKLANVVFVTPSAADSDHSGNNRGTGPSWVASIVNAIGSSAYWNDSAILVIWDDWGGWYDHVVPTVYNSYELGMRVPLIVVSPYAKRGYVSHVPYEFGSILKFIEETFELGSLGTTDTRANDLSDCFSFQSTKRKFRPIRAKYPASYFLHEPVTNQPPDDY